MKNTSPFSYAKLIVVLAEGLRMDLFTKEEITQWADRFILQDEQPDIFFIELALSHTREEAISLLNKAARNMNFKIEPRPLLGALYKKLVADKTRLLDIAGKLWPSAWEGLLTEQEDYFMNSLAYAAETIDVVTDITRQQLERDTLAFLSIYQGYTIANYVHWEDLDKEIHYKLTDLKLLHITTAPPWWQFWKR